MKKNIVHDHQYHGGKALKKSFFLQCLIKMSDLCAGQTNNQQRENHVLCQRDNKQDQESSGSGAAV